MSSDAAVLDAEHATATAPPAPSRAFFYRVVLFAALGGFLFGYDTAVINAALLQIATCFDFHATSWRGGLVVSLAVAGAFFGSATAGLVGTSLGRRAAIIVADVLFIAGSVALAAAPSFAVLLVGRLLVGAGVGIASVVVPVYLSEVTAADRRGAVITLNNVFITGGQFVAAAIGGLVVAYTAADVGWRILFAIGALPAVLQLAGLAFLPESPRWLHSAGRHAAANRNAAALGIDLAADIIEAAERPTAAPLADERAALNGSPAAGSSSSSSLRGRHHLRQLLRPALRRRLGIGCGLQALQQLCGINTIMYYSAAVLKDAGFKGDTAPVLLSIPLALTNAAFTIVGIYAVERWGRRVLLWRSLLGCLAATLGMSVVGFLIDHHGMPEGPAAWLFLALLVAYLASFAPGMGPIPWIVNAEIYPTHLRSDAAAIATMTNWGFNAIVSQSFPVILDAAGAGPTFLIIVVFIVIALVFVRALLPETRGVPLEDMDGLFGDAREDENGERIALDR